MNKKYLPLWQTSSFQHLKYTLVRNQKQLNKLFDCKKDAIEFMSEGYPAQVNLIDDKAIVQIGSTKGRTKIEVYGLILHEAVHVWQQIKLLMREDNPSIEFEAYSIQLIAINLFSMYEDSEND